HQNIGFADANRVYPNKNLTGAHLGLGYLYVLEHVGAARLCHLDGEHEVSLKMESVHSASKRPVVPLIALPGTYNTAPIVKAARRTSKRSARPLRSGVRSTARSARQKYRRSPTRSVRRRWTKRRDRP